MADANLAPASVNHTHTVLAITLVAFALLSVLFLLQENGLLLNAQAAHYLHELTHDGRHALGVPCH
jgi:hypothetical protein